MGKRKTDKLAGMVERYRRLIDTGDEDDESDDLFRRITAANDPAAIPLLLLMRASEDDPDLTYDGSSNYSDSMEEIAVAMRLWEPQAAFMDEFVKVAGELCRSSSTKLLKQLLDDIMAVDGRAALLAERLDRLPPGDVRCLAAFVEGRRSPDEQGFVRANYEKVLVRLKGLG